MHGARDGSLWIGTSADVERWKDGHLVHHDIKARVRTIVEDASGDVWASRAGNDDGQGPVCRITGSRPHCFGKADGIGRPYSVSLATTADGGIWFASSTTVTRLRGGSVDTFRARAKGLDDNLDGVEVLVPDNDGSMLVGLVYDGRGGGLQRLKAGQWQSVDVPGMHGESLRVSSSLLDREGALWVGTSNSGVYRVYHGQAQHYRATDGLSGDKVIALFEDREGALWVCTSAGVDRLRDTRVATLSTREGLSEDAAQSLSAGVDGSLWISNSSSVDRLKDGRVTTLRASESAGGNQFTVVKEDRSGRLWAGVDNGLAFLEGTHFKHIATPDKKPLGVVIDLAQDADGSMWALALAPHMRLVRIRGEQIVEDIVPPTPRPFRILAATDGGLWLMAVGSGIMRYENGHFSVVVQPVEANFPMHGVAVMPGNGVVAVNNHGVVEWRDGRVRRMSSADGLPCELSYAGAFDRHRDLWIYAACGLVRISAADMAAWWAHPGFRVTPTLLDATDGAQPQGTYFGGAALMDKDGRLWFANGQHPQMLDPEHIRGNDVAPSVHVQAIVADRRSLTLSAERLLLAPRTRDIEIDYTAPSFVVPQKVHFRYLLEGHDVGWQDAGTRRQAFYTDLPPGQYRFRVIASNNDGVWNNVGASTEFSIPPTFAQTRWFIALCVLIATMVLWLGLRLRLRQISTRIRIGFQARMRERERIARELHDTLLQSTQGLVLMVHGALKMLSPDEPAGSVLRAAVAEADAVISEGRDRIQDLRSASSSGQGLVEMLGAAGDRLVSGSPSPKFSLSVIGEPRSLNATIEDECHRIASEALTNAFRHAQARQVDVVIDFGDSRLQVIVRDDGKGIGTETLEAGGAPGHWGMQGMRERARRICANLAVRSPGGGGTEVVTTLTATLAYKTGESRWRRWNLFR